MLTIQGGICSLQEFTEANLQDPRYYQWLRDLEVVQGIYRLEYLKPLDMCKIEAYARKMINSETDCYFGIYLPDREGFIGTAKLGHIDWRTGIADVGVLVGEKDCWGKGVATDAVRALCGYGFTTLSLRKISGGTAANNIGMVKCFERVGFAQEGVLRKKLLIGGEYLDHLLYGLFAGELKEG